MTKICKKCGKIKRARRSIENAPTMKEIKEKWCKCKKFEAEKVKVIPDLSDCMESIQEQIIRERKQKGCGEKFVTDYFKYAIKNICGEKGNLCPKCKPQELMENENLMPSKGCGNEFFDEANNIKYTCSIQRLCPKCKPKNKEVEE